MNCFNQNEIKKMIIAALKEDIGKRDITTDRLIPEKKKIKALLLAKEDFIVSGLEIAALSFKTYDKNIKFKSLVKEGGSIKKGRPLAVITGKARSILIAERVALNFLSLLSGISTKTKKFVLAVKPYKVKILDTRKTIPGLRMLEKYAVRMGGGYNHRSRLDEMVLIKDNHLEIMGNKLRAADFAELRKELPRGMKIEVEVENLAQFKAALKLYPDIVMLDNMPSKEMKKAVQIRNNLPGQLRPIIEASGGISLSNVKQAASTGIDLISIGDLTHSFDSVDISLEIA